MPPFCEHLTALNHGLSIESPQVSSESQLEARPPHKGHLVFAGQVFPRAKWYRRANLRKVYIYTIVLILTNTANGFDGSMMNGLQTLKYWREYFNEPKGSILGLFNALTSLGSLIGLFFVHYMVDWWGRNLALLLAAS
jgi:hypothetical protein